MSNPDFLKQKYDLHNAPEVKAAAKRMEKRHGERISQDPEVRIQNYLDRFKEIIERKDPKEREMGILALKKVLHDKFVLKSEEIPENYFDSVKRRHREEGYGDIEIPDDIRHELSQTIINDQINSLDNWIDYLASDEARYPDWLKYYAVRNILKMGRFDKEKSQFTERYGKTVSPFPELNREALAITLNAFERQEENKKPEFGYDIKEETKNKFLQLLRQKNFPKLYALTVEEFKPISEDLLSITKGEWVKYPKGSNAARLVESLSNYGTGWCLRGEETAKRYLDNNDLHVFYSLNQNGNAAVPRVVMVIDANDRITEVRGAAKQENLDPYIGDVVKEKLDKHPNGKNYEKRSNDMKRLTEIERKTKAKQELDKDELVFLYEMDSKIEGFGYQRDPRIGEIRDQRKTNLKEDAAIVFECEPSEIAWGEGEINEKTKAYVGPLFKGIFVLSRVEGIEHIYTSFPEGKISKTETIIGGESEDEIRNELKKREESEGNDKIYVSHWAKNMLKSKDFYTLKEKEQITLVKLKVRDLGFPNGATTEEIYKKAEEYGLELCPPETGPRLRLNYEEIFKRKQPKGEYFLIAMKQIADPDGDPRGFDVSRYGDGWSWLNGYSAKSANRWHAGNELTFCLRKFES